MSDNMCDRKGAPLIMGRSIPSNTKYSINLVVVDQPVSSLCSDPSTSWLTLIIGSKLPCSAGRATANVTSITIVPMA